MRTGAQGDAPGWEGPQTGRAGAWGGGGGGAAGGEEGGGRGGRPDGGGHRHYTWGLALDPEDPDCWYISASPGPRQAHSNGAAQAFIYRWRGNGPWQALGGGLPQPLNSFPYALASAPGALYAGLGDGRIYGSYDGGDTWRPLALRGEGLPSVSAMVCVQ